MDEQEDKESTPVDRPLPIGEASDFTSTLDSDLTNGHTEDDLVAYSPPAGGWTAWIAGERK